jgi:hypothetical protein
MNRSGLIFIDETSARTSMASLQDGHCAAGA